jgi:ribosomal protein S18 acetylase RimI-like enzyme
MTTTQYVITRDKATSGEIELHLKAVDLHFVPPLSSRVGLGAYATKIHANAARFEAWKSDELVGLVAMYCNVESPQTAFITSVSVLADWRGKGIADSLLQAAIDHARTQHSEHIALEVNAKNTAAVRKYETLGFRYDNDFEGRMVLNLAQD